MADRTNIEWTGATWNPIRARRRDGTGNIGWHCEHASPGCENCYAEKLNTGPWPAGVGTGLPFKPGHLADVEVYLDEKVLLQPLRWRRGRMIFPCSMTDLFGRFVTDEMLDRIFAVMAMCPQHTFQPLTKRSARMRDYLTSFERRPDAFGKALAHVVQSAGMSQQTGFDIISGMLWPLPNVWQGVSVEDQRRADERIDDLRETPAAIRWLSIEPLLGPIDLAEWLICPNARDGLSMDPSTGAYECCSRCDWTGLLGAIDWIVVGGESGAKARPMHPGWARSLRDQCAAAGVPFFFKQWGEWAPSELCSFDCKADTLIFDNTAGTWRRSADGGWIGDQAMCRVGKKAAGRLLDGELHDGMPEVRP